MSTTKLTLAEASALIEAIEQSGLSPAFVLHMAQQIAANNHKGAWSEWRPSRVHFNEFRAQRSRALASAITSGDRVEAGRLAIAGANYCSKAWELFGKK